MQTALFLFLTAMSDELVTGVEPLKDAVVVQVAVGGCVDGPALAHQIEARAGPGSVVDVGPRTVDVAFTGTPPAVFVGVTLDVDGQRAGGRRLGPFADCAAAVDAAALAIALVIDPFAAPVALSSSPEPSPSPSPPTTTTTTPPAVEIVRAPALTPPFSVGVGAAVGVGSGFGVVPGPTGLVRLRLDAGVIPVVVALGGRVDVPAPLVLDGRRRLETVGGAFFVEGCHRLAPSPSTLLDSCALVEAGGLRGTGVGFDNAVPTTARLIGLGAAFTLRTALGAGPGAFARVVVAAPVLRARLVADGVAHWESPARHRPAGGGPRRPGEPVRGAVTDPGPPPQTPPVDPATASPSPRPVPPSTGDMSAHAGVTPTLTDIYAAEVRWVWRALWRLGVPDRDLEDVAHDVFVVVHRKLNDYDPGRPLRPWLFGICFRVALDRRRKGSTSSEQLGADHDDAAAAAVDDVTTDAVAVVARKQIAALVHAALATLPLEQRAVVVLHELEGIAVADCVAVLDAPLNTLYSRLRLGRVAFARAIARLGPADGSLR